MRPVSDAFLLQVAEISATLIGLFLVAVFFYVETGFADWSSMRVGSWSPTAETARPRPWPR